MLLDLSGPPANPSSIHAFGQRAKGLLTGARQKVAAFFGCKTEEILFTSGGTESINYFLRGVKGHIITTEIEHPAIYKTLQALEPRANGSLAAQVTTLPVGLWGAPLPEQIEEAVLPQTGAIVLSASNGETGVKIDLKSIARIAEKKGIPLFIDAVSTIGKDPFTLYPGITAVALSGHKFHGPKGVGALFLSSSIKIPKEMTGGSQEMGRRAGTENLAGILGLAEALQIISENQSQIVTHLNELRNHLESSLFREIPEIMVNGQGPRISNTSNIAFLGVDGESLLMQLDLAGIAVSHGSACSSGSLEPSRVLTNMGIDRKRARSSIRFSLSRLNTREEIDRAIVITAQIVKKLRQMSFLSLR